MGDAQFKLYYSKWYEGADDTSTEFQSNWDDTDLYGLAGSYKFNDNFKAGAAVYYFDSNDDVLRFPNYRFAAALNAALDDADLADELGLTDTEIFFYGLNAEAAFDIFKIDGFVMLQDGEFKGEDEDLDISAWAASVKGQAKLANGDIGLRLIYFSAAEEDDEIGAWLGFGDQYEFVNENQMIFLVDPYVMNYGKERYALNFGASTGYGLMGAVLSGNHNLPQNMYLKWGAGYYQTVEDKTHDIDATEVEGETLGYELCVRVGKKFFDKVDVSLNGAYADFGDFFDDGFVDEDGDPSDPDSIYKAYLMVNVPF
jgi:hypothetical protein